MYERQQPYRRGYPVEAGTRHGADFSPELSPSHQTRPIQRANTNSADMTIPRIPFGGPHMPHNNIVVNINGTTNINNYQ